MRYLIVPILIIVAILLSFVWNTKTPDQRNAQATGKPKVNDKCKSPLHKGLLKGKIKGMSFVAPPNPFKNDPVEELSALGVDWLACLPYAYFKKDHPKVHPSSSYGGWWGERPEGVCETVRLAHQNGVKVMIKPQLWTHDQWIGDLDFKTDEEWEAFEASYTSFIMDWVAVADSMKAEMFCIGTEIRHSAEKRPEYWRQLIKKIRKQFKGKLTYAPNWDDYAKVSFWDDLDYIGADAYFPLLADKTPEVCDLKDAWQPTFKKLKAFSEKWDRPILFTEFGYLSLDGCADKTWELEKKRQSADINEQAQANAIQALLETFGPEDWWAGGFQWKWYPSTTSSMGEGKHARDYTPQGKIASKVIETMYQD